jgi:hypothetical protein
MKRVLLGVLLLVMATMGAAHGQTAEEKAACKPDAYKFCNPGIADAFSYDRIVKCMKENKTKLSPECRAAMKAHGL